MICRQLRVFAWIAAFALTVQLCGQQQVDELPEPERTTLLQRLRRLDISYTDWTLMLDVGEKAKALGARAIPVLVAEIATAAEQDDPRYGIRLMGVLTRIDPPQGITKLEGVIASADAGAAALAARVLGRSAPAANVAAVVVARLPAESRGGVASSLAMAAGDAGATGTAMLLREMIENGKVPRQSSQWFALALAQVAEQDMQAEAPRWLRTGSNLAATGVLLVRRTRDVKAEQPLLELLPQVTDKGTLAWFAQTLGAMAATPPAPRSAPRSQRSWRRRSRSWRGKVRW